MVPSTRFIDVRRRRCRPGEKEQTKLHSRSMIIHNSLRWSLKLTHLKSFVNGSLGCTLSALLLLSPVDSSGISIGVSMPTTPYSMELTHVVGLIRLREAAVPLSASLAVTNASCAGAWTVALLLLLQEAQARFIKTKRGLVTKNCSLWRPNWYHIETAPANSNSK